MRAAVLAEGRSPPLAQRRSSRLPARHARPALARPRRRARRLRAHLLRNLFEGGDPSAWIEESTDCADLIRWLQAQGAANQQVALRGGSSGGDATTALRGLRAVRALTGGSVAASIPEALVVTPQVARAALADTDTDVALLSDWDAVVLFLARGRRGCADGEPRDATWGPYVCSLPACVGTVLEVAACCPEALSVLAGASCTDTALGVLQSFLTSFEATTAADAGAAEPPPVEDIIWAHAIMLSRAALLPGLPGGGPALLPWLDMANHAPAGADAPAQGPFALTPRRGSIPDNRYFEYDASSSAVLLRAPTRGLRGGDELTIDYGGGKTQLDMLLLYGFLPRAGSEGAQAPLPSDACMLALPPLSGGDSVEVPLRMGALLPAGALAAAAARGLGDANVARKDDGVLSLRERAAAWGVLASAARDQQSRYPRSLKDDRELFELAESALAEARDARAGAASDGAVTASPLVGRGADAAVVRASVEQAVRVLSVRERGSSASDVASMLRRLASSADSGEGVLAFSRDALDGLVRERVVLNGAEARIAKTMRAVKLEMRRG
ncbi:unnamed protein product [Pedinophyceae sp. YPF-701]|nr:unnamed protein product [Pedinophyceae sp. YPF-701]